MRACKIRKLLRSSCATSEALPGSANVFAIVAKSALAHRTPRIHVVMEIKLNFKTKYYVLLGIPSTTTKVLLLLLLGFLVLRTSTVVRPLIFWLEHLNIYHGEPLRTGSKNDCGSGKLYYY